MKIVCEMAKDHGGSMTKAKEMIRDAAGQGVYAVKFQAYDLKDLNKKHANYKRNKDCHLTIDQLKELKDYANIQGVQWWCSVFSKAAIEPLSTFSTTVKVPSTFLLWSDFVSECLLRFPRVHISTGMHSREDVKKAIAMYSPSVLFEKAVFYHCISEYPTGMETKLNRIRGLGMKGFSYHGTDEGVAAVAAIMGAEWLEIHYSQWMHNIKNINKGLAISRHLMHDDGKPTSEELKNYKFYKSEFNGAKKCLK